MSKSLWLPFNENLWYCETDTLTHIKKKLNTRWSARIWGNFPPWTTHAKTNQTTRLCFPFYCWHANNTSVVVYARDTVSPLTKTKDQNRLCSSTLCSVAREFMKDSTRRSLEYKLDSFKSPVDLFCNQDINKDLAARCCLCHCFSSPSQKKHCPGRGFPFLPRWKGANLCLHMVKDFLPVF